MERFILAITGPAGSGKSTIAAQLAKHTEKCVNIDVDHVKHFIVSGFKYDTSPEGVQQWQLLGNNVSQLAHNFLEDGYNVIINGYINEPAWDELLQRIKLTHRVLLLPQLGVLIGRDKLRQGDYALGKDAVGVHYRYFSNSNFFDSFAKIDSSAQSVDETVEEIKKLLSKNRGDL